jgi:hypothetical protein
MISARKPAYPCRGSGCADWAAGLSRSQLISLSSRRCGAEEGGSGGLADVLPGALELEIPTLARSGKDADAEDYLARCWPVLGGVAGESVRRVDLLKCFAAMGYSPWAYAGISSIAPGRLERLPRRWLDVAGADQLVPRQTAPAVQCLK